jgi:hypothetical protein
VKKEDYNGPRRNIKKISSTFQIFVFARELARDGI